MDILIIGTAEREAIKKLIKYAEDNPFTLEWLEQHQDISAKETGVAKAAPESAEIGVRYTIEFQGGVNVTYTHEQQSLAECRHMSVSSVGKYPSLGLVEMMMEEFGFVNKRVNELAGWIEDLGDGRMAVNLLEPLDGNMNRLRSL